MTEEDKQEIAAIFIDVLESHGPCCPNGIDADTAAESVTSVVLYCSNVSITNAIRVGVKLEEMTA